jgi:hypothetical protein
MTAYYSARSDVEAQFGVTNVTKWADLDNDGDATKIADRIDWAITLADAEIEDRLRYSQYIVPIVGLSGMPPVIVALSAMRAGVLLYDSRGAQDFDPDSGIPMHRLAGFNKRFETTLNDLLSGRRTLSAVRNTTLTTTVPERVPPAEDTYDDTGFLIDG